LEFVVGRDDPGDPPGLELARVAPDLHLGRRVGDLLDGYQNLHRRAVPSRSGAPRPGPSHLSSRVIRNRSPGMNTRSKTTGVRSAAEEVRSEKNAGSPPRPPSSRAPRPPGREGAGGPRGGGNR